MRFLDDELEAFVQTKKLEKELRGNPRTRWYVGNVKGKGWWVREAFRLNELDVPEHEQLIFECNNQFYDHSNGRLRVMPKTLLKKFVKSLSGKKAREFDSPDFFEALMLTYAKFYVGQIAKKKLGYLAEFEDSVHILDLTEQDLYIGVSRFNVLVAVPEDNSAYLVWACADRKGLIYFYDEVLVERATSSSVDEEMRQVEARQIKVTDLRYCEKLYRSEEDLAARYNLIEQLEDYDYTFEELEYNEELAKINLREGLKYDKTLPVNNGNHPYIFFSPKCPLAIRAIKYYSQLNSMKDNPTMAAIHKAVGLMVLSEPEWLPNSKYA